ncbi:MAG: BtpA/SgcQ family protein [Erysipelotrichaceae bacterium]|nr:BtpA/SgcQ family protein [Erysipelotrichaceae bacterium]
MKEFFDGKKKVIGMVHLLPLPANAAYKGNKEEIIRFALEDAKTLIDCGVDAIMLENFNDWPQYADEIPWESYTLMTAIASKIRDICPIPFGVNVEMNAWYQEWIMAWAVNADFIRLEAFVDNRAGSFGYIPACSTPLSKVMKDYPAEVMLFADVHTAETYGNPDVPINELAHNAIGHDAHAIVVTENDSCKRITVDDVRLMREEIGDFPIIVGSGVKTSNVLDYFEYADAVIVGRGFKTGDRVDEKLVREFMDVVRTKY